MNHVKVSHLTSAHPKNDIRIFNKECKTLVERGYDVSLIVQNDQDEIVDGVKILAIDKPKNRKERMTRVVKQVYERALEIDAAVYHFHDPELIPVGLRLKYQGKKVIYDVHEDVPRQILSKTWVPGPLRKSVSWTVERIENLAVKRFDFIVTATPFIRDRFLKINRSTIDINNFPILSELHMPNDEWDRKEKLVCYVGGIAKTRGIHEMIEALPWTESSMLLAGTFVPRAERNIVVGKEGWSRVFELGYLNRTEIKEVLSRSMAGLVVLHPIPNYVDSLPIKMFEYMSAGLPVIASHFPLWIGIIEGNNCGICVDPMNIREIADAINWIINNPEQAKQKGENGRRAVEEKYNWEAEGTKLINIYEKVMA